MLIWIGFFISFVFILLVARKSLWIALFIGSYLLGIFSLSFTQMLQITWQTFSDPTVFLLAISVGIIPVIGGVMEKGGLMDDFVTNVPFSQKMTMAFSSAFVGMLPMPGGALLSAPMIAKAGDGVSNERKAAINVWYRHVLLLIYPLGVLLATSTMAKVNLYTVILFLLPGFALMMISGSIFLLRNFPVKNNDHKKMDGGKFAVPVFIILIAPVLHFSLMTIFPQLGQEIPLLIAVLVSLVLSILFTRIDLSGMGSVIRKMKPWNFSLIIFSMFQLLNIFTASETSRVIADSGFSLYFLMIGIGFLLGLVTGRVQVPISILLPIIISQFGWEIMSPMNFAIMFFAVYQGYVISPVHPCVSVTLEFFDSQMSKFLKLMLAPVAVSMIFILLFAYIVH